MSMVLHCVSVRTAVKLIYRRNKSRLQFYKKDTPEQAILFNSSRAGGYGNYSLWFWWFCNRKEVAAWVGVVGRSREKRAARSKWRPGDLFRMYYCVVRTWCYGMHCHKRNKASCAAYVNFDGNLDYLALTVLTSESRSIDCGAKRIKLQSATFPKCLIKCVTRLHVAIQRSCPWLTLSLLNVFEQFRFARTKYFTHRRTWSHTRALASVQVSVELRTNAK